MFFCFFFVFLGLTDSLETVTSNSFYEEQKTKFLYQAVILYIRID